MTRTFDRGAQRRITAHRVAHSAALIALQAAVGHRFDSRPGRVCIHILPFHDDCSK
jgi:hypothetical protein